MSGPRLRRRTSATANRSPRTRSAHGYDQGGWLPPGLSLTHNTTGRPEPILSGAQWDMSPAAQGGDGIGLGGRAMAKRLDRMIHLLEQAPGRTGGAFAEGDQQHRSRRRNPGLFQDALSRSPSLMPDVSC